MAKLGFLMFETLLIYMFLMTGCSNEVCKPFTGASTHGWIQWGDNYYKVIMEKMTWLQARDACAKMGGVMATPKSDHEGRFFASITPKPDDERHNFWINCNDRLIEGTWECDGSTTIPYEAWGDGEPNNYGTSGEDCGVAKPGGISWLDIPCSYRKYAVCKRSVPRLYL